MSSLDPDSTCRRVTHWLAPAPTAASFGCDCLCVGTGRFLRAVLVPALNAAGLHPVLVQTRGRNFLEYMHQQSSAASYPVDTVLATGEVQTDDISCFGAFSWGQPADKAAFYDWLEQNNNVSVSNLQVIAVGVTEAGLSSAETPVMKDLYQLLTALWRKKQLVEEEGNDEEGQKQQQRVCVLNTDNVPNNGSVLQKHMEQLASSDTSAEDATTTTTMRTFLKEHVVFLDSMVDRITSQRPGSNGLVPRAEPLPAKAMVVLDEHQQLPAAFYDNSRLLTADYGFVIRSTPKELDTDIQLKLRVANGTHTAVAHALALLKCPMTDALSIGTTDNDDNEEATGETDNNNKKSRIASLLLQYLDALFEHQILASGVKSSSHDGHEVLLESNSDAAKAVYEDWRKRLTHAHFGLSSFFITQNGPAKGGIRLGPTVMDLFTTTTTTTQQEQQSSSSSSSSSPQPVSVAMAFAFAVLLRWLTPMDHDNNNLYSSSSDAPKSRKRQDGIFRGCLQGHEPFLRSISSTNKNNTPSSEIESSSTPVEYADGLFYHLDQGWYEFRCACQVSDPNSGGPTRNLSQWLGQVAATPQQPAAYVAVVKAYLVAPTGGNLQQVAAASLDDLVQAVCTLYARLVVGDNLLDMLEEMTTPTCSQIYTNGLATSCAVLADDRSSLLINEQPLHYRPNAIPDHSNLMKIRLVDADATAASAIPMATTTRTASSVVASEVESAMAIDLHTHLLPPTHGALCLWGIDELLTYHYLVAEFFMTAPASLSPEAFYAMNKKDQADIIWKALFIDRSPISEACRGVITTLKVFGLSKEIESRDLEGVRAFFRTFRDRGLQGVEAFSDLVFEKAGVSYCIMTNIPFSSVEAQYWRPKRKPYSKRYKSALRVDPLLAGDKAAIDKALLAAGYDTTMEGARQYVRDWCDVMSPEYMMASTPHDFVLADHTVDDPLAAAAAATSSTGVNEEAMKQPGAFADVIANTADASCKPTAEDAPSLINETSDYLSEVLMHVCAERDLPLALKIGAHRAINPRLKAAGDGMVAFADASMLGRLCARFPDVRFLATFLSRNNQHEACVLANKFRNLHLYGCWWYCNNPSIIREITSMRLEMLGTAFTAQHSDSRVLEQIVYKWAHSRAVIAGVLVEQVNKLLCSGWSPTRSEIRRDVARLFGGSYEAFMEKSLL